MKFKDFYFILLKETGGLVNMAYYDMIILGKDEGTQTVLTGDLPSIKNGQANGVVDETDYMVYPYPGNHADSKPSGNTVMVQNGTISSRDVAVEELELKSVVVEVEQSAFNGSAESGTRHTEPKSAVRANETGSAESNRASSDESITEAGESGYVTAGGAALNGNSSQSQSDSDNGLELDAISLDLAEAADMEMRKRMALSMGSTRC